MVLYEYDRNAILLREILNRNKDTMVSAYKEVHTLLVCRSLHPKLKSLDNEVSNDLIEIMEKEEVSYQLILAHNHWRNKAEQAIITWGGHFLARLSNADTNFPMERNKHSVEDTHTESAV